MRHSNVIHPALALGLAALAVTSTAAAGKLGSVDPDVLLAQAFEAAKEVQSTLSDFHLLDGEWPAANEYAKQPMDHVSISHDERGNVTVAFTGVPELSGAMLQTRPQNIRDSATYWSCLAINIPVDRLPGSCTSVLPGFGLNVASLTLCPRRSGNICRAAQQLTLMHTDAALTTSKARLVMQEDGNLVVYDESDKPRWASHTDGNPGAYATFQLDGNLVVYDEDNEPLFASGTDGKGANLVVQADGNVVIYDADDQPVWATNSNH